MSVPPPRMNEFAECLIQEVKAIRANFKKHLKSDMSDAVTKVIHEEIQAACKSIHQKLKREDFDLLDQKIITDLTDLSSRCTQSIRASIGKENDPFRSTTALLQTVAALENFLTSFQQVLIHKEEIDQHTLEYYLAKNEPWAQTEFISLIHLKHPWAEEKLAEYVAQGNSFALQLLLSEVKSIELIIDCKDAPNFREGIIHFLNKDIPSEFQERGSWLLEVLRSRVSDEWMQAILKEIMAAPEGAGLEKLIVKIWEEDSSLKRWLENEFIQGFRAQHLWANVYIYQLLEHSPFAVVQRFANDLLREAGGNIQLLQQVLSLGALLPEEHPFRDEIRDAIRREELCNRYYPSVQGVVGCFERIQEYPSLLLEPEAQSVKWAKLSTPFRLSILWLILKREQRLIDVFNNHFTMEQYHHSRATSDCFPKAKSIMTGHFFKDESDPLSAGLVELAQLLAAEQVPLLSLIPKHNNISNVPPNIRFLLGETAVGFWVRDSCVAHSLGMRIPNILRLDFGEIEEFLVNERRKRLAEGYGEDFIATDINFGSMGTVFSDYNQLKIASYFFNTECPFDPTHNICFTYSEGGNCLIGEENGERYAIIGKDALAFNLRNLKEEAIALGFRKLGGGRWEQVEPYSFKESDFDEKDLRLLFSLDLGVPFEKIYFVENLEYHLDMAMAILDEKTVIVNDSQEAMKVWEEYAAQKMSAPDFVFDRARYEARLEEYHKLAKDLKQYEDATAKQLLDHEFDVIRIGVHFMIFLKMSLKTTRLIYLIF